MKPFISFIPLLPLALLCAACVPITSLTTSVDPRVVTLARSGGGVDTSNVCTPPSPPAPPAPDLWWNALPPGQPPKVAGLGVVGFNLWRNGTDSCTEFRQDLYRTEFGYPLASLAPLKGLVTKAELNFSSAVLPVLRPGFGCELRTAAAGAVLGMPPNATLPAPAFSLLPPAQPFPPGAQLFAMTFPWQPGSFPGGVTTTAVGGDRAAFTLDVTARVTGALARGDAELIFALSGLMEARSTVPPPASFDCRAYYRIGPLTVTHL